MSNTLPTMTIIYRRGHATTNLCPRFGVTPETIHHLYQCTYKGSSDIWTALVDALCKSLKARNTEPDIVIVSADALLYTLWERNNLPQCPNLTLHSKIFRIGWLSILWGIIPTFLARTQQTYFNHTGNKNGIKMGQSIHHKNMETNIRTMASSQ